MRFLKRLYERLSWRVSRRYRYRRHWDHLNQLDDHLLRDIGLNRQQIQRGWRVLEHPQSEETLPNGKPRCHDMA